MRFERPDQSPAGAALTRLIVATFRLEGGLMRAGDQLGRAFGISNARWQVMEAVEAQPLPVAQIARDMGLRRQGVQPTVNALERAGLVEFRDNPNHLRAKLVALSPRGRNALDGAMVDQVAWVNDLAADFSERDLARAASLLELVWQQLAKREGGRER